MSRESTGDWTASLLRLLCPASLIVCKQAPQRTKEKNRSGGGVVSCTISGTSTVPGRLLDILALALRVRHKDKGRNAYHTHKVAVVGM